MNLKKFAPAAMLVMVAVLSACGQEVRPPSPVSLGPIMPVAAETNDATCFMPLSPETMQQLAPYVTPQPGTGQNVCVLEPESDGEYEQQYYNEGDSFPDFWYYVLLARTVQTPVFSTGVIAEPTLVQRAALAHWVNMNKYGAPYTSYEVDTHTGKWSARKADKPVKVKHVRYGTSAPVQLNKAATPTPPLAAQNYKPQPPPASQGSGTVNGSAEKRNTPPPVTQAPAQQQPKAKAQAPAPKSKK